MGKMKTIKTSCPLCDEEINTLTPDGKDTGRFFICCPRCKRDVCLTLSRDNPRKQKGMSQSLVVVEEETGITGDRREDIHWIGERETGGKSVIFFRGKKKNKTLDLMDNGVDCSPLIMEMEGTDAGRNGNKIIFPKKKNPPGIYEDSFASEKKSKRGKPIRPEKREKTRNRSRQASMGLFFITFVLGILFFVSLPLYPSVETDTNENSAGANIDIMGRVFSGVNEGSVVSEAEVTIDELKRKTSTNPEGYFFFEDLPEGTYTVTARKKGLGSATSKSYGPIINLQLSSDSNSPNREITFSESREKSTNSYYAMTLIASFSSLAAVIALQLSKKFYPPMILGIIGIASIGFAIGSICALGGVVLFIYSKIE